MDNIQKIGECYPFVIPYGGVDTNVRIVTQELLDAGHILVIRGNQFLVKELTYIPIIVGPYKSHYYCTVSWLQGLVYNVDSKVIKPRQQVHGDVYLLDIREVVA